MEKFKKMKIAQIDVECRPTMDNWRRTFLRWELYDVVEGPPDKKKGIFEVSICYEGAKKPDVPNFWRDRTVHDFEPFDVMVACAILKILANPLLTIDEVVGTLKKKLREILGNIKSEPAPGKPLKLSLSRYRFIRESHITLDTLMEGVTNKAGRKKRA